MTYTMVKKTKFAYPTEKYLNVVKCGYKDCELNKKYLIKAFNALVVKLAKTKDLKLLPFLN